MNLSARGAKKMNLQIGGYNTLFMALFMALCIFLALQTATARAEVVGDSPQFRAIYKELVEINTTLSVGSCTEAAGAMAAHLRQAGIPEQHIQVIVPEQYPRQGNLVAKIPGTSPEAAAILLLAHIDVVEAKREDWVRDPFKLVEEEGYFYGRGVVDDKAMAAIFVDMFVDMRAQGYQPERTLKLALTCGEETPNHFNGVSYLIKNHRALIDAGFAINEGGGGRIDAAGNRTVHGVQAGEKVYQDFWLEVRNPGGHSSLPLKDNAIYRLTHALQRIEAFEFPVEFNDTTRSFFQRMAKLSKGRVAEDLLAISQANPDPAVLARVARDPVSNSILRTTCVATQLEAGHAPNALPQRASANVNCRIFPGHTQEEIRLQLEKIVNDEKVVVTFVDPPESTSPPPPLVAEIMEPIEGLTQQMWPGVPVVPRMIAGGTDGRFLTPAGIPTYGVSGLFVEPGKVNAHGLNESVRVDALFESREFLNRLVRIYAGGE